MMQDIGCTITLCLYMRLLLYNINLLHRTLVFRFIQDEKGSAFEEVASPFIPLYNLKG